MATTLNSMPRSEQKVVNPTESILSAKVVKPTRGEVTFVPAIIDLQAPLSRFGRALQVRRQIVDYMSSLVSGALSLR